MKRALVVIDGEHYPPVVRDAIAQLPYEVIGAWLAGGSEKLRGAADYGVPLVDAVEDACPEADVVVDMSDEPVLGPRGASLVLRAEDGRVALHYTDLFAYDADGQRLPAWMRVEAGAIVLYVDDAGARYPVTIDPLVWAEQQRLVASDWAEADQFGSSVALSGDTVLVGAWADDDYGSSSGSAYVFVRTGDVWTEQAQMLASDGENGDRFGYAVALDGDTAVVGAEWDDDWTGSAYVFRLYDDDVPATSVLGLGVLLMAVVGTGVYFMRRRVG